MLKRWLSVLVLLVTAHAVVFAVMYTKQVDIPERAKGSERVVVGKVKNVTPRWYTNSYGDKLIVSEIEMDVEETLKGPPGQTVLMDVDGGTIDGLTLGVSDLPAIKKDERFVVFLDKAEGAKKVHKPHLRGLGILKLGPDNVVEKSSLKLDAIRKMSK